MNNYNLLFNTLPKFTKPITKIISAEEGNASISGVRFFQDTAVNLAPKVTFSRSKEDLVESTFLELSESVLVYFGPLVLGNKIFKSLLSKGLSQNGKKLLSKNTKNITKTALRKKIVPKKAALALGFMMIPIAEYSLNFVKNLMTLKAFDKANFANVVNLSSKKDDRKNIVDKSSKKQIKKSIIAGSICLVGSVILGTLGHKSKNLYKLSEYIVNPVENIFSKLKINKPKLEKKLSEYINIDFVANNGKLGLSKGQLTSCVLLGGVGYYGAAKDRGNLEKLEILTRFPLVGFYVIEGSNLFDNGVKKIFNKFNSYKDIFKNDGNVIKLNDLPKLAEELSLKKNTKLNSEFKSLFKKKAVLSMIPFVFGIGFMGFFVAGVSRLFTQIRYNRANKPQTMQDFLNQTKK